MNNEHAQYLFIPGWHGSDADHWQSQWHDTLPNSYRVEQRDWIEPILGDWMETLDQTIRALPGKQIVLVAHSLGCVTVAHWARNADSSLLRRIGGALLVAPADVERNSAAQALRNFGPIPLEHLPFPSVLVGSTNSSSPLSGAGDALKSGRSIVAIHMDAIQERAAKVDIEVESSRCTVPSEALDQRHRPGSAILEREPDFVDQVCGNCPV